MLLAAGGGLAAGALLTHAISGESGPCCENLALFLGPFLSKQLCMWRC